MKILIITISSSILLIILAIGLFFIFIYGTPWDWEKHDKNLENFSANFENINLPEGITQMGVIYRYFGLLGNGNQCDYHVSKIVKSDLPKEKLTTLFDHSSIPQADAEGSLAYGMERQANRFVSIELLQLSELNESYRQRQLEFHQIDISKSTLPLDSLYLLRAEDRGYEPNDPRCD